MADEPGRFSLGFSVTPDELTVVTDQGHTVTLIDTGVELVDSYRTIVARATNGEKYPIVVNESQSHAAIGANWQHDEGGNPNADGRDYVKIIDDQNAYVNVQLIAWLMQFGASFRATFLDVYIKNGTEHEETGLTNYSCHIGDIMQINSYSGTRQAYIYDDADGHLINCAGDGYCDTAHAADDYKVSKNPSDTDAYNNYWVLKALGVPLSVLDRPETVTVTTNDGVTVTLVRTEVRSIDGIQSIVAIDNNGDTYPIVVNKGSTFNCIGSDWGETTGGNVENAGVPHVQIMDSEEDLANPQILQWLISKGATFVNTFPSVYIKSNSNQRMSHLTGYSCHTGDNMQIDGNDSPGESYIYGDASQYLLNCAGDGYGDTLWASGDFPVSADSERTDAYYNYLVLKALGVPMSVIES